MAAELTCLYRSRSLQVVHCAGRLKVEYHLVLPCRFVPNTNAEWSFQESTCWLRRCCGCFVQQALRGCHSGWSSKQLHLGLSSILCLADLV
jgi:hypothetical protein